MKGNALLFLKAFSQGAIDFCKHNTPELLKERIVDNTERLVAHIDYNIGSPEEHRTELLSMVKKKPLKSKKLVKEWKEDRDRIKQLLRLGLTYGRAMNIYDSYDEYIDTYYEYQDVDKPLKGFYKLLQVYDYTKRHGDPTYDEICQEFEEINDALYYCIVTNEEKKVNYKLNFKNQ